MSPIMKPRTALMITLIGWFAANGCIQPGIELTGTLALEMNENGITSMDRPCAAWALPATSPMKMKIQVNAYAGDEHEPEPDGDLGDAAVGPPAHEHADDRGDEDAPGHQRAVGDGASGHHRGAWDRQRAEPVVHAGGRVLGDARRRRSCPTTG